MVEGKSLENRVFNLFNSVVMVILIIVTVYPIWFSLICSLNNGHDLDKGAVLLWPRVFTWASWKTVLGDNSIISATFITLSRTVIVTIVSILNTAMFSYAFSRPYLKRKGFYRNMGFISMYFGGGLIPTFMLMNWLHLYDTYMVYILPCLFGGFYNVIIFNANFKAIPESLFESAKLDGASEFKIFLSVVLPLSKPVIAALTVFTAVGIWNDYGTTLFYTQSTSLQTLQYYILKLIQSTSAVDQLANMSGSTGVAAANLFNGAQGHGAITAKTVELAAMILATIPIVIAYPFAQKYFVKGVMVGSVKE